jgi:hypothetical protein
MQLSGGRREGKKWNTGDYNIKMWRKGKDLKDVA